MQSFPNAEIYTFTVSAIIIHVHVCHIYFISVDCIVAAVDFEGSAGYSSHLIY